MTGTFESAALLDDGQEEWEPPVVANESRRGKMTGAVGVLLLVSLLAAAAVIPSAVSAVQSSAASLKESAYSLKASNEYERARGFPLGDGEFGHLVQVYKPTRLELLGGHAAMWTVESAPGSGAMMPLEDGDALVAVEHTFTTPGAHKVSAQRIDTTGVVQGAAHEFEVSAKVIRYELRDLSEDDRQAHFDALHQFYNMGQGEGEAAYGSSYKSISYLVRQHLYGGADKACDHWHDDAGILNHHVGVTWSFEQSLRLINPATAAHYWDYTREESEGIDWYDSVVFGDEWFGSNAPRNDDHIVDTGRFAYTPVLSDAAAFSEITNPYGLLRSPWNTNPTPYLMRSNRTFFSFGDGYNNFPSCSSFSITLQMASLAYTTFALNGALHGPVHLMVGGHWDNNHEWAKFGSTLGMTDKFLLLSKWLWRAGFVRTPESCSSDTAHADCMPTCPSAVVGKEVSAMTNDEAYQVLKDTGVFDLSSDAKQFKTWFDEYGGETADNKLNWVSLLDELCHVGSPGEMFTSSAPQDPLFWPLHGNAERLVMYLRVLNKKGTISFDETWGYEHHTNVPSDTGLVCDWSAVDSVSDMPTCTRETCPGHKEDDLLPFTHLFKAQGDSYLSNKEFYNVAISPYHDELPYMYDSLSYWKGCTDNSLLVEAGIDDDGDVHTMSALLQAKAKSLLQQRWWGVM